MSKEFEVPAPNPEPALSRGSGAALTVAICTRNRCQLLEQTLDSITRLTTPADLAWEVIVVDNGSTDATAATVSRFTDILPLRLVIEPRAGLSLARNAAVLDAKGDYMLWLDDDVLLDPGWLLAYVEAFRRWPEAAFFGGPIIPHFEGTPPQWLAAALPNIGNAYASLDLGVEPRAFDEQTLPYGANLVIRMPEQRQHPYDPRLGRRGTQLLAGEEWTLLHALVEQGATGRWVPGARVRHIIPPARQSLSYLRRYYRGNGESLALVRRHNGERTWLGRPRWVWREAVMQEVAYRLTRFVAPSPVWSEHLKRSSVAWGMLRPARGA